MCTSIRKLPIEKMSKLETLDLYQTPLKSNIKLKIKDIKDVDTRKTQKMIKFLYFYTPRN